MSTTVKTRQAAAARALRAAGIESASLDARLLMAQALGVAADSIWRHGDHVLAGDEDARFLALLGRRSAREPMAYILGTREFWSLPIGTNRDVLIPRPDSETLVEAVLATVQDHAAALEILDLGTGSGCLLAALLKELPCAQGIGVDISVSAIARARRTFHELGLEGRARFVCGDWAKSLSGTFDIVVSNPPYVALRDRSTLAPEVRDFEPALALFGGDDGLEAYRALLPEMARLLKPGGLAAVEIGAGQGGAVTRLGEENALSLRRIAADLAGMPRAVLLGLAREKNSWISPAERLVCEGV